MTVVPRKKLSRSRVSLVTACTLMLVPSAFAQKFNPAIVQRGKETFGPACGFCHGLTARGGDGGPDLARSLFVLGDENGKELGELLKTGRQGTTMPAFPNMSPEQVSDMAVFLHERVEAARNREGATPPNIVIGDAAAGLAYFNGEGKCSGCHSVSGDLKGIGAKYEPIALQDKFLSPRAGGGRGGRGAVTPNRTTRTVKVTPASGPPVSGTLLAVSDFAVTLLEPGGQRRSFTRDGDAPKVEITDPLQAHKDLLRRITDKDIHNLTAYLVSLK
jgi:cytochrome c oxidase cbb3-type subunit 3